MNTTTLSIIILAGYIINNIVLYKIISRAFRKRNNYHYQELIVSYLRQILEKINLHANQPVQSMNADAAIIDLNDPDAVNKMINTIKRLD